MYIRREVGFFVLLEVTSQQLPTTLIIKYDVVLVFLVFTLICTRASVYVCGALVKYS